MEYIDIDKDSIPYSFEMTFDNKTYEFKINYNTEFDYFSIDLLRNDKPIILGEKLVYGKPLFASSRHKDIPKTPILPFDTTGNAEEITFENFNEDIFLYLVGDEE